MRNLSGMNITLLPACINSLGCVSWRFVTKHQLDRSSGASKALNGGFVATNIDGEIFGHDVVKVTHQLFNLLSRSLTVRRPL